MWDAVGEFGRDPGVDAVIVTGADPAFCAGVDLKELSGATPPSAPPRGPGDGPERDTNGLYRFLPVIDKPVIGAINGVAATGGLEIALQCTFLVASEQRAVRRHARPHRRHARRRHHRPAGAVDRPAPRDRDVPHRQLPHRRGGPAQLGLVNHVVPHDELLPFTRRLATDIVNNDQRGVRRLLAHYRRIANSATLDEAHLIEGYMAETWTLDTDDVAARRAEVTARGRSQAHDDEHR